MGCGAISTAFINALVLQIYYDIIISLQQGYYTDMPGPASDGDKLPGIILPSDNDSDNICQVTPLMVAAYHGDVEIVSTLLQQEDQNVCARNIHGQTALSYAIDQGDLKIIDLLLAYDADIDEVDTNGCTILHRCVHHGSMSKVETCLTAGINMDIANRDGETPLIIAAKNGLEDVGHLLITSGCDMNTQNREGLDAFEQSFCSNHTGVYLMLSNERDTNVSDFLEIEMLKACEQGNELMVQHIIHNVGSKVLNFRHKNFHYQSPMIVASRWGHLRCCEILRKSGAYIDTPDDMQNTPLIVSVANQNLELVRWFIGQGARINRRNLENKTALHVAVLEGNLAIVKHLVENGALLHHRLFEGYSALHIAAQRQNLDILEYLLQQGAVADVRREKGITPLLHVVEHKNIDMLKTLVKHGASVNRQDYVFDSPLSVAVKNNALHLVTYLVENGADVNLKTSEGISLIDLALLNGYNDIVSVLTNVDSNVSRRHSVLYLKVDSASAQTELFNMCKTGQGTNKQFGELLRAGATANATDDFDRTPLIVAAQNNYQHCVEWLLAASANIFARDKNSFTALGYAILHENVGIVKSILQNMGNEDKTTENAQSELERAVSLSISGKSTASVEIIKVLLKHKCYTGYKNDCTFKLLEKSITAENVNIVELLFNYQLQCDSFEPDIVTIACPSQNLQILQHFLSFVSKSAHQSAYTKCAVRFCLANQLEEALHIFATKPINTQDIFWSNINQLWFCSDHVVFKTVTEMAAKQGLIINSESKAGYTFFMVAASKGIGDIVGYLLKYTLINFDIIGSREYAFQIALDGGHYETAAVLSEEPLFVTGKFSYHILPNIFTKF